jgi:endonuclease/exonuclease/phosphatase family metal-dependent hydrolase
MINKITCSMLVIGFVWLTSLSAYANNRDRELNVATYNMYIGTDFSEILGAQSAPELVSEVAESYGDVVAGKPAERIDEIADQIATSSPNIVGLQEVALWQTGAFGDPGPATNVAFDFLQMLLDELAERGLHYEAVAVQKNLEIELPGAGPAIVGDVRFTDRVVILARTDLQTSQLKLEGSQAHSFSNLLSFPILTGQITLTRGWTAIDVKMRGKTFRFINAHLESFHPVFNFLQGTELLEGPANTTLPLILAGDLNSDAENGEPTYQAMLGAGLRDSWKLTHPNDPGYTWALFLIDPSILTNPSQRLDLILTRGAVTVTDADVIGEHPVLDLTASGLRPSDHAGVAATAVLKP